LPTRIELRQQLKAVIETVYDGIVTTSRNLTYTGNTPPDEFVSVLIIEGEVLDEPGIRQTSSSVVSVLFYKTRADDDDLDEMALPVHEALSNADLQDVMGLTYNGFSYSDEENSQYQRLTMTYLLTYVE